LYARHKGHVEQVRGFAKLIIGLGGIAFFILFILAVKSGLMEYDLESGFATFTLGIAVMISTFITWVMLQVTADIAENLMEIRFRLTDNDQSTN